MSFQLCSIYGAAVWYTNRQRSCESGIKRPPIFSLHPTFPLWPLREQEPLSELFIQSASPGGLDRLLQALLSAPKPPQAPLCLSRKTAVFRAPPSGPASASLPGWVPVEFDFKTFYIQPRFAFKMIVTVCELIAPRVRTFLIQESFDSTKEGKPSDTISSVYKTQFASLSQQSKVDWNPKVFKAVKCVTAAIYRFDLVRPQSAVLSVPPRTFGDMVTNWLNLLCERMSCFTFESLDAEEKVEYLCFERDGGLTREIHDLGPFL